jgi:anaerobic selenocysteine-containing dehydrogenase
MFSLNSSFQERDALRERAGGMRLLVHPDDARDLGLAEGDPVLASNPRGEVRFRLAATARVPRGVVVAEGVWWLEFAPGDRAVNALTAQRLTDRGGGSTFYDNRVHLARC